MIEDVIQIAHPYYRLQTVAGLQTTYKRLHATDGNQLVHRCPAINKTLQMTVQLKHRTTTDSWLFFEAFPCRTFCSTCHRNGKTGIFHPKWDSSNAMLPPPSKIFFCAEVPIFSISVNDVFSSLKPFDFICFCGRFHAMFVHTCELTS